MRKIARTVSLVKDRASSRDGFPAGDESVQGHEVENKPFSDFREKAAIVLLGDPGMGKTTEFEREAAPTGRRFITARDFLTLGVPNHTGETLFIDGLDEVRAGSSNVRVPFDEIRNRLQELGNPHFRLSCREADWRPTDKDSLEAVSQDGEVTVLRLNPLTDENIDDFLSGEHDRLPDPNECKGQAEAPDSNLQDGTTRLDPDEFKRKAKDHQLYEMMRNPQILDSLIKAVGPAGTWPESKTEVFDLAIKRVVMEYNEEHAHAGPSTNIPEPRRRKAAEYLCASMLLADEPIFVLKESDCNAGEYLPSISSLGYDDFPALAAAIQSKLFKRQDSGFTYIHRNVAEYLCASCLQQRMEPTSSTENALPRGRVLALLTSKDGEPVSALRGVYAWLTTLSIEHRQYLMKRNPLGIILYGDVSQFSLHDKQVLLDNLKDAFKFMGNPYQEIGNLDSAFASFCTKDNAEKLISILRSEDRSKEHQWLTACVLMAIRHGEDIHYSEPLLDLVKDSSWYVHLREEALEILISKDMASGALLQLLQDIQAGTVDDDNDRLVGILLDELYPHAVTPNTVFDYYHSLEASSSIGMYVHFWHEKLSQKTDDEFVPILLDNLVKKSIVFSDDFNRFFKTDRFRRDAAAS